MPESRRTIWTNLATWKIEGQGWDNTHTRYSRLPRSCKKSISENLYNIGRTSTGLHVCFETESPAISVRWKLTYDTLVDLEHPGCGYSGLDLYARDENGTWRWAGAGRNITSKSMSQVILSDISKEKRQYLLFFPLRNTPKKIEIGIQPGCTMKQVPRSKPPIAFYGTSLVHGAYASRPGMIHPSLLSRWLDYPVINLGFSGAAKLESEMAMLLAELDPCLYVIDPLANPTYEEVEERFYEFVSIIRNVHPKTPIICIEDAERTNAWLKPELAAQNQAKRRIFKKIFNQIQRSGQNSLYYISSKKLQGDDDNTCVDGIHPTDLGYVRMAKKMLPVFKKALGIR